RRTRVLAFLAAEKEVLDLVHAGVREQQRRIVAWNERGARHDPMAVPAEELEERRPDFVGSHVFILEQQVNYAPMATRSLPVCATAIALTVAIAAPGAQQQASRPMLIRASRVLDVRAGRYRAAQGAWIEDGRIR